MRSLVRASAVAAGAVVTLSALAAPSYADLIPEGCAGSVAYACTGDATPPPTPWNQYGWHYYGTVPVRFEVPSTRLVPSTSLGGQELGGVVVTVGGQTIPGTSYSALGPTDPVVTGIVVPVNVCVVVTCILAGTPVVVPGIPLPVVPVVIPSVRVPAESVEVPVLADVPAVTTPEIATPYVGEHLVSISTYTQWAELWWAGHDICEDNGGSLTTTNVPPIGDVYGCSRGTGVAPATALLVLATAVRFVGETTLN